MQNLSRILIIAGILLLVNVLSNQFFYRLDITKDKQYTLSNATKNILKNLEDPVTIQAYFSEDLPTDVAKTRSDFKDLLIEYNNLSKGNVAFEFIDPGSSPEKEQEVMQQGIQPFMLQVRQEDQVSQQKAYMGAVINIGEQKDIIPLVQPGAAMEYALTTGIKKLSVADKPSIGIIQGHGEPGFNDIGLVFQSLSILYEVEQLDLAQEPEIPSRFKTIVLMAPRDTIPAEQMVKIDRYLELGGNLLLAIDAVDGDFTTAQGNAMDIGLSDWLASKGVAIDPQFILDASCGSISVQRQQAFFTMQQQVQFPYFPLVKNFLDHPVTEGLEAAIFQFASPIRFLGDSVRQFIPLVQSSDNSAIAATPTYFNVEKQWTQADFPVGPQNLGVIIENAAGNNSGSKMIIFSDGDFAKTGQSNRAQGDNVNLMVNSIDWLSDDTGLIDLRTKGVITRPIEDLEDSRRTFLKYLNFALPIVLVLLYGFYRNQRRKMIREKRRRTSYTA